MSLLSINDAIVQCLCFG